MAFLSILHLKHSWVFSQELSGTFTKPNHLQQNQFETKHATWKGWEWILLAEYPFLGFVSKYLNGKLLPSKCLSMSQCSFYIPWFVDHTCFIPILFLKYNWQNIPVQYFQFGTFLPHIRVFIAEIIKYCTDRWKLFPWKCLRFKTYVHLYAF